MDDKNQKSVEQKLDAALTELVKTNQNNQGAGACIYTPPSGRPTCLQLTSSQCSAIAGVYIGGPCSNTEIENNKPIGKTDLPDSPIVEQEDIIADDCVCTYGGQTYSKGTIICMGGTQYKCGCNGWVNIGFNC